MTEQPEYSLGELVLAGLFIATALPFFIWAGHEYFIGMPFDAMEGAGLGLVLLAGCVDPKRYVFDCLTFPFRLVESAGRDTKLSVIGGLLGSAISGLGWGLNWYFSQTGG